MLTLKEFFNNSMNDNMNRLFAFLLEEVCRYESDVIEYLTLGMGTIINENIGIAFPESKSFTNEEEGYLEKGMELYFVSSEGKDGFCKVKSFFMSPEVAYRYLRLFYNTYIELNPNDEVKIKKLEHAYESYRKKYGINDEVFDFDYYNVFDNIDKYIKWYWNPK